MGSNMALTTILAIFIVLFWVFLKFPNLDSCHEVDVRLSSVTNLKCFPSCQVISNLTHFLPKFFLNPIDIVHNSNSIWHLYIVLKQRFIFMIASIYSLRLCMYMHTRELTHRKRKQTRVYCTRVFACQIKSWSYTHFSRLLL